MLSIYKREPLLPWARVTKNKSTPSSNAFWITDTDGGCREDNLISWHHLPPTPSNPRDSHPLIVAPPQFHEMTKVRKSEVPAAQSWLKEIVFGLEILNFSSISIIWWLAISPHFMKKHVFLHQPDKANTKTNQSNITKTSSCGTLFCHLLCPE